MNLKDREKKKFLFPYPKKEKRYLLNLDTMRFILYNLAISKLQVLHS